MRTLEEITALSRAAKIRVHHDIKAAMVSVDYLSSDAPACAVLVKGEPPILVLVEPLPTLHITSQDSDEEFRYALPVMGDGIRAAIVRHLGLSTEEAELVGLTPLAARDEFHEMAAAFIREVSGEVVDPAKFDDIEPTDPRWGRP